MGEKVICRNRFEREFATPILNYQQKHFESFNKFKIKQNNFFFKLYIYKNYAQMRGPTWRICGKQTHKLWKASKVHEEAEVQLLHLMPGEKVNGS